MTNRSRRPPTSAGDIVLMAGRLAILGVMMIASAPAPSAAQAVHAVLFHSPTCPHCRQVISEDLPLFFEVYGGAPQVIRGEPHLALVTNGQLEILFIDASQAAGGRLYEASLTTHPVTAERLGVPRLIVGDSVLVGSVEIPSRLHGLIRAGLAAGGLDWPEVPGLHETVAGMPRASPPPAVALPAVPAAPPAAASPAVSAAGGGAAERSAEAEGPSADSAAAPAGMGPPSSLAELGTGQPATVADRVRRDPVGNGLAVVILGVMILVLAAVAIGMPARLGPRVPGVWLPLLALIGAAVAAYLTYVETTGAAAVCGPVGDCNMVQQSPYARLFGLVPIGALGLAGYGAILVLWVLGQDRRPMAQRARRTLVAAALVGTVFSIYLTALEPFVIGATCMWCLSSAAIMTGLLWLAAAWRGADTHSWSDRAGP